MASNLTKRDIILELCDKTGFLQKEIKNILHLTLDCIVDALVNGRNVELRNFGIFELKMRKPRVGRNPNQPAQQYKIPARKVVKFKLGKALKQKIED